MPIAKSTLIVEEKSVAKNGKLKSSNQDISNDMVSSEERVAKNKRRTNAVIRECQGILTSKSAQRHSDLQGRKIDL